MIKPKSRKHEERIKALEKDVEGLHYILCKQAEIIGIIVTGTGGVMEKEEKDDVVTHKFCWPKHPWWQFWR